MHPIFLTMFNHIYKLAPCLINQLNSNKNFCILIINLILLLILPRGMEAFDATYGSILSEHLEDTRKKRYLTCYNRKTGETIRMYTHAYNFRISHLL